jgi:hypothetical protein
MYSRNLNFFVFFLCAFKDMEGHVSEEVEIKAETLEARAQSPPATLQHKHPTSGGSQGSHGRPFRPEVGQSSPTTTPVPDDPKSPTIPKAPHLPDLSKSTTELEGVMSNCALVSAVFLLLVFHQYAAFYSSHSTQKFSVYGK